MLKVFKNCALSLIAIFSLLFSGCYSVPVKTPSVKYNGPIFDKTLAVMPLQEMREKLNSDNGWLILLPLVPYGTLTTETPEFDEELNKSDSKYAQYYKFRYQEAINEFDKEIFLTLKKAKLFTKTNQIHSTASDVSDYLLEGELLSTKKTGNGITYGLSLGILPFMLFGVPTAKHTYYLIINLRLINSNTEEVIWEKEFEVNQGYLACIYSPYPDGLELDKLKIFYDYFINEIMVKAIPEIKTAIEKDGIKPIKY